MIDPQLVACLAAGAVGVAAGPAVAVRSGEPRRRSALALAALPAAAFLVLFGSLAVHVHQRLGGWPERIGVEGFPDELVVHADVALFAFGALLLGGGFAWPVAVVLSACVPGLRPGLRALGVYAVAGFAALAAMQLAPEPFLYWWWD